MATSPYAPTSKVKRPNLPFLPPSSSKAAVLGAASMFLRGRKVEPAPREELPRLRAAACASQAVSRFVKAGKAHAATNASAQSSSILPPLPPKSINGAKVVPLASVRAAAAERQEQVVLPPIEEANVNSTNHSRASTPGSICTADELYTRVIGRHTALAVSGDHHKDLKALLELPTGHEIVRAVVQLNSPVYVQPNSSRYNISENTVLIGSASGDNPQFISYSHRAGVQLRQVTTVEQLASGLIRIIMRASKAANKATTPLQGYEAVLWGDEQTKAVILGSDALSPTTRNGQKLTEHAVSRELGLAPRFFTESVETPETSHLFRGKKPIIVDAIKTHNFAIVHGCLTYFPQAYNPNTFIYGNKALTHYAASRAPLSILKLIRQIGGDYSLPCKKHGNNAFVYALRYREDVKERHDEVYPFMVEGQNIHGKIVTYGKKQLSLPEFAARVSLIDPLQFFFKAGGNISNAQNLVELPSVLQRDGNRGFFGNLFNAFFGQSTFKSPARAFQMLEAKHFVEKHDIGGLTKLLNGISKKEIREMSFPLPGENHRGTLLHYIAANGFVAGYNLVVKKRMFNPNMLSSLQKTAFEIAVEAAHEGFEAAVKTR